MTKPLFQCHESLPPWCILATRAPIVLASSSKNTCPVCTIWYENWIHIMILESYNLIKIVNSYLIQCHLFL